MYSRIILIAVVTIALLAGAVSGDTIDIDERHELNCEAFSNAGETSDELVTPNADIKLTESYDGSGVNRAYFHIDYQEDIVHTLRIYIPEDCVAPYGESGVESVSPENGPSATYIPVNDGEYLSITVTLTESGEYVYPIKKSSGFGFSIARSLGDKLSPGDGDEPPSEWQYIDNSTLANYGSTEIPAESPEEVVVQQYRQNDRWVAVSDDPGDGTVFVDRSNESVTVVSTVENPAQVRYNLNPDSSDKARGIGSGISSIANDIATDISKLLNGILSSFGGGST